MSKHVCVQDTFSELIFFFNSTLKAVQYKPLQKQKTLNECKQRYTKINVAEFLRIKRELIRNNRLFVLSPPLAYEFISFHGYHGAPLTRWAFVKLSAFRRRASHSSRTSDERTSRAAPCRRRRSNPAIDVGNTAHSASIFKVIFLLLARSTIGFILCSSCSKNFACRLL